MSSVDMLFPSRTVAECRKKLLNRPRLHTQISECQLHPAHDFVGSQLPDLITRQRWIRQQFEQRSLHFGQCKWYRKQHALPI